MKGIEDSEKYLEILGEICGFNAAYMYDADTIDTMLKAMDAVYTIAQPEPNGLFKPEGLSATWLIMIDPATKKPRPVYVEPTIIVSPFKLK